MWGRKCRTRYRNKICNLDQIEHQTLFRQNEILISFARTFIFTLIWKEYNSIEVGYGLESWRVVKELQ